MDAIERLLRVITREMAEMRKEMRAIHIAVDPTVREEPKPTTRKKDPRALYGSH